MISRYEAYMDGIALSSIDPAVCVLDIKPGEIRPQYNTSRVARRDGAVVDDTYYEKTGVDVVFEIHEYDTVKRQAINQRIQAWAKKGVLTVSDRPGQRLVCVCEKLPVANAKAWTEPITMTFAGYNPPYWEELNAVSITLSGASGSSNVYIPGNADKAYVLADITFSGETANVVMTVGKTSITLSGLSVSSGDHVYIGYDSHGHIYIRKNTSSIMDLRTPASSDDLVAECGKINTFAVSASASVSITYTVRGCWL